MIDNQQSNDSDLTEEKLREIINVGNPKTININGVRRYISKDIIKQMKTKTGGIFPLIPILAGIFGATAAAAATASGIASTVSNSRDAHKKKLEIESVIENNKKLEIDKKKNNGEGLYLDPLEGKGLTKSLDRFNESGAKLDSGAGLFFDPYFGKGLKDSILNSDEYKTTLEKPDRRKLKELLKKMSKNKIKILPHGNGLFLEPFELSD